MMYHEQHTFEMLKKLPTELNLEEISVIVGQFPDFPSNRSPWWQKPKTWFVLLLLLIIGGITWLFSIQLSTPPSSIMGKKNVQPNIHKRHPVNSPLEEGVKKAAPFQTEISETSRMEKTPVNVIREDPNPTLSHNPIAISHANPSTQVFPVVRRQNSSSTFYRLAQPIPSLKGKWSKQKNANNLCFDLRLKESGEEWKTHWKIPVCCSEAQLSPAFSQGGKRFTLVRESGEMVFARGLGASGSFTFFPNPTFVNQMEASVLNVKEIPLETLSLSGSHKQSWEGMPIYSQNPYSLLWLKFFLADIDSTYTEFLKEEGFEGSELEGIWHLADSEVPLVYLQEILSPLKQIHPEISLADLANFFVAELSPHFIKALASASYRDLTTERLLSLHHLEIPDHYILELSHLGFQNIEPSLLGMLYSQSVDADFIQSAQIQGYKLPLKDYLLLKLMDFNPQKGESAKKAILNPDPISVHTFSVPSFYKLIVRGNIRVLVKEDSLDEVKLYTSKKMQKKIQVKFKEGVLKISPRPGFTPSHYFDVKVSASELKDIVSGNQSKIFSEAFFDQILHPEN